VLPPVTAIVEAGVGDNWAAVAEAIRTRLVELSMTQKDLVARSGVSESTIRQLQNNYGPRRRNRHTLVDVSKGLRWPADYLARVLDETMPGAESAASESWQAEVAALRERIDDLTSRVDTLERDRQGDCPA
jgi:transcriptional regulator with XRE-family HTH domain